MRLFDLVLICALALFWNGLVPVAGAFYRRRVWRGFRRRFSELRLRPVLDYAAAARIQDDDEAGGASRAADGEREFRFIGLFESLQAEGPEGRVLWIQNRNLTVPVALDNAETYILPEPESDPETWDPSRETPQRIQWDQLSGFSGGTRVYVGGTVEARDKRAMFVSGKANRGKSGRGRASGGRFSRLLVIIFDGADDTLSARVTRAGRQTNEYWNSLTPYSLILGAFSQFFVILSYWRRPAFQITVYSAIAALCLPLYPLIPPAFLFTLLYRRLWWRARLYRAWRDLIRLPLRYLGKPEGRALLPGGERYGGFYVDSPDVFAAGGSSLPLIIPERALGALPPSAGGRRWYVFGALGKSAPEPLPGNATAQNVMLPGPPRDPLATWGAIPGDPELLARWFTRRAYFLETLSLAVLLSGIIINIACVIYVIMRFVHT